MDKSLGAVVRRNNSDVARVLDRVRNARRGVTVKEIFEDDENKFSEVTVRETLKELEARGLVYVEERQKGDLRTKGARVYKARKETA